MRIQTKLVTKTIQHKIDFTPTSAIKTTSERRENSENWRIRQTFYGEIRLYRWQFMLPLHELLNNNCKISDQKRRVENSLLDLFIDKLRNRINILNAVKRYAQILFKYSDQILSQIWRLIGIKLLIRICFELRNPAFYKVLLHLLS